MPSQKGHDKRQKGGRHGEAHPEAKPEQKIVDSFVHITSFSGTKRDLGTCGRAQGARRHLGERAD
jgi:hypothetical protein